MGEKLSSYFKKAEQRGGIVFKARLSMKTGISEDDAAKLPDTPDVLMRVEKAFKEIEKDTS